jgi:hypothetical protein
LTVEDEVIRINDSQIVSKLALTRDPVDSTLYHAVIVGRSLEATKASIDMDYLRNSWEPIALPDTSAQVVEDVEPDVLESDSQLSDEQGIS